MTIALKKVNWNWIISSTSARFCITSSAWIIISPIVCCVSSENRKADKNDFTSVTHGVKLLAFSKASESGARAIASKYSMSLWAQAMRYQMMPRNSQERMKLSAKTRIVHPKMRNFVRFWVCWSVGSETYAIADPLELWIYPRKKSFWLFF